MTFAAPVAAQDLQFADPATTAWAGRVRDRLATRDSLESVYTRANDRMRANQQELYAIQSARPAAGETVQQFQQRIYYRQQQLQADMTQTQALIVRSQQRLDPLYTALRKDYDYARIHPDPSVRQSVGSLIATAAHGLDPIWIKMPVIVTPAAGAGAGAGVANAGAAEAAAAELAAAEAAAGAAASATGGRPATGAGGTAGAGSTAGASTRAGANPVAAAVDPMRDQTVANAIMQNGSARNVPPAGNPATTAASEITAAEMAAAEAASAEAAALAASRNAGGNAAGNAGGNAAGNAAGNAGGNAAGNAARTAATEVTAAEAAAATATTVRAAPTGAGTIWTMEADAAAGVMRMHARDASTMQRIAGVEPVVTRINTGADATVAAQGSGQTLGNLRRTAWMAETNPAGQTTFRAVDWRSHQPVANGPTIAGEGPAIASNAGASRGNGGATGGNPATSAASEAATAEAAAAAAANLNPSRLTSAVWTAEANPATGMMVLRARDAVTNNHLSGVAAVETQMAIPPSGRSVDGSVVRNTFRDVTYTATRDAATGQMTFQPTSRSGAALSPEIQTVTAATPGGTRNAGTAASTTRGGNPAASETAVAETAAAEAKRGFQMPSAGQIASSAAKWGGLSIGVTLAANVGQQFIQNGGRVDWKQATDFLTDSKFWGGTAGGFVGSLAGGALASFVPGGAFVKAALSIGGAAMGYQIGSGSLRETDWMGLGVTTVGAAAGTALGAMLGPWGAMAGGIAGHMLSQWIYDKIKEARQQGPYAGPIANKGSYPQQQQNQAYVPPAQLPPRQFPNPGQMPGQFPVSQLPVSQMPVSQMPTQMPTQMPGQFPGQVPMGVGQLPVATTNPGQYGSGLPSIPNAGLMAGPPGAGAYSEGLAEVTARMNRAYQEKLMADQAGNQGMAYQKMMEYQALRQKVEGLRRSAYQSGSYGDYRQ